MKEASAYLGKAFQPSLWAAAFFCSLCGGAAASERAVQLVNSFEVMCTVEPLNYAALEAKALAMKLPERRTIKTPPAASGYYNWSRSWLLPLKSGPHEFVASETRGPAGLIEGCGIGAPDVGGEDFRAILVKTMKLGQPSRQETSPDGSRRMIVWRWAGDALTLIDASPASKPGIYLSLFNQSADR